MSARNLGDCVHVRALAVKMHRHNCFGRRGDLRLDLQWIDVECVGQDIDEYGLGADSGNRTGRGEKRVGRGDHFIARPDPLSHQRQQQRICARRHPHSVPTAAVLGDPCFAFRHHRSKNELLALQHRRYGRNNLLPNRSELGFQVEQWNGNRTNLGGRRCDNGGHISFLQRAAPHHCGACFR